MTSISRSARRGISPTGYMRLESPCQPSRISVTSILTMSPSRSGFSLGMPWQTTWLIEVQVDLRVAAIHQGRRQRAVVHARTRTRAGRSSRSARRADLVVEHVEAFGDEPAGLAHAGEGFGAVQFDLAGLAQRREAAST